ncbi:hypothetical protein IWQ57_001873 [Coemansia nantahalensis]|uniref:Uncharacterized protein n=1 Tax=Coemansia nantahalensis TaxID=2789366 RepID=A0ACC1K2X3_9FUNG|nr:hypothetical protein IWQ57_001873 [Coemansia nantahalensis]
MYLIAGRRQRTGSDARDDRSPAASREPAEPAAEDWTPDGDNEPAANSELEDGGLDDPDLLGELEALRREMGLAPPGDEPASTARTSAAPGIWTADGDIAGEGSDDDEPVSVTEEDLNDPTLLAALASVAGEQGASETAVAADRPPPGPQPERTPAQGPAAVDSELLQTLLERQDDFKQAALSAKRQGDIAGAREMLVRMKQLQAAADAVRSGQALPRGFEVPARPVYRPPPPEIAAPRATPPARSAPAPAATPKRAPAAVQHAAAADNGDWGFDELATSIDAVKERLSHQLGVATRLAEQFLKGGDKQKALEFHRLKKQAAADLATLGSYAANGRQQPPPFLHRTVQWAMAAEQRRDIGAGQLQVAIGRVSSDGDLAATLGGESDFYVQWELGWPRDRGTRGYTRTIRFKEFDGGGGSADARYTHAVDMVDRQNTRPLQRWADRARLTVELYKYMGLLWGSQLIGRAALPLAALRAQSEAAATVEVKAVADSLTRAGRPLPGGPVFVDVAARLRLPLSNAPETTSHSEHWIYIDAAAPASEPAAKEQPPHSTGREEPAAPVTAERAAAEEPAAPATAEPAVEEVEPAVPAQPAPAASADKSADAETVDDIATKLDLVDGLVSNAALELELELLPARIRAAGDSDAVHELQSLEAAVKVRMGVVAAQVEAGALTIQAYMAAVAAEAAEAKRWALAAKRGGRRDLAVRALQRAKAMQAELDEMAAAMDGAGDE